MRNNNIVCFILFTVLLFSACSKNKTEPTNNNNNTPAPSNLSADEQFLVGDWVFEKGIDTFRPKNDWNNPKITEGTMPCRADDVYHLKADKTYTKDEGKDSCTGYYKTYSYEPKPWSLQNGNMTFEDGPNKAWPNSFTKIDDNHFSLRYSDGGNWDGTTIIVFYFKRK